MGRKNKTNRGKESFVLEKTTEKSRPKNNSLTKLHFGCVNSVLCTKCNKMRGGKKKRKSKEILCKTAHTVR